MAESRVVMPEASRPETVVHREHLAAPDGERPVETRSRKPLRLAYLVNKYPFVSHTFIRRELLDLERRGHEILRLSIRHPEGAVVDPLDKAEMQKTIHVLKEPRWRLMAAQAQAAAGQPGGYARAMQAALEMARRSDRGMVRHAAYLAEAAYLLGVLKREGVQHVHVHFGTNSAAVARLIRLMGGPSYSMMVHGAGDLDSPVGYSLGEKMRDAAFVTAISDHCASQLKRWIPWEEWPKIHILRCTVGEEFFEAAQPIDPESRTLVCVGRLATEKGHMVLLEGFAMAVKRGVNAKLVLAGDGELRPIIERRIAELGLKDRVQITGWVDEREVRRLLGESRALVMASFNEGLPMVIMEAMAMGRPAIATAIAGIPELVLHGRNGWLVTPGRADLLADAIQDVMESPLPALETMAKRGRELVRAQHYTPTEGDRLENLLYRYVAGAEQ